jgi:hypothetical protein
MLSTEPGLTFDRAGHVYRYGGRVVPSVTQVLGMLQDFSNIDPDLLERSAEFGKHVHAMIDLETRGELDEEALDGELLPYLNQWRLFLRESGFKVTASEKQIYHPILGYAGTCDTLIGQQTSWVLEVKSGAVPRSVGAQLAAYQQALSPKPRRRLCLKLTANDYRLHECKDPRDFSLFVSCLNVWRFQNAV